jgi:hypothetical protein
MKRKLSAAILAGMLTAGFVAGPATAAPAPSLPAGLTDCSVEDFNDNTAQSQYYLSVRWMQCAEISQGYSNNTYRKGQEITRGEAVAFIQRYMAPDYVPDENADQPFADVHDHHTHYVAVSWAEENDIVTGYRQGDFNSTKSISRGEFATMLFRAGMRVGLDLTQGDLEGLAAQFKDIDPNSAHFQAIQALAYAKIINGYNSDEFRPYNPISRGEVAELTFRGHQVLVQLGLDDLA